MPCRWLRPADYTAAMNPWLSVQHVPSWPVPWIAHAARVAVVASIAWLVHAEHARYVGRQTTADLASLPIAQVQRHLPEVAAIGGPSAPVAGGRDLLDAAGERVGTMLRTSPAGDAAIGFSGPTDLLVVCDRDLRVAGMEVLASRDDAAFRGVYRGMSVEEIAGIDPRNSGVEGVSGATMTSQAVAEGIVRAVRQHVEQQTAAGGRASWRSSLSNLIASIDGPQWGGLGVVVAGIITAFTRLRGTWFGRLALPIVVLAYLGFGAGALLSQAQVWGWAQAGVARGAVVLMALTLAALVLPITTRRNVYCSHLCAHGAAQQLLVRFLKPKRSVPGWLKPVSVALPWVLLTVAILASLLHWPLNLVDLEPFDAYLPAVAGVTAIVIFAVSLIASSFYPMAYCRHGCPTGALLDHLRLHRRADRFSWRDGVLLGCLAVAAAVHGWPV